MENINSENTKQRLLLAAVMVFAEKGYDAASIREIAKRANANSALIQYYFQGKEGLYRAVAQFLFDPSRQRVLSLPTPPTPEEAQAKARAIACLKGYVRALLEDLLSPDEPQYSKALRSAAHVFWKRELLQSNDKRGAGLLDYVAPYINYLNACLMALCPEADAEARFLMGCSIQSQILFFHHDSDLIAKLRGAAYGPKDIGRLADHVATFSLGGLGLVPLSE